MPASRDGALNIATRKISPVKNKGCAAESVWQDAIIGEYRIGRPDCAGLLPLKTSHPALPDTIRTQMMKHVLCATVAMLGLATAIPAFADGGGESERIESAGSLPPGFYDHTDRQIQAQIKQDYFAAQQAEQAKLAAKGVNPGGNG